MATFILWLFTICVGIMTGLGNMLHMSYETVNVILFCYVEPIFAAVMIVLAILAVCNLPVARLGIWIFWIVACTVALLMIAGGFYLAGQAIASAYGIYNEPYLHMPYTTPAHIAELFNGTVQWLSSTAKKLGMTYEVINLVVYVLMMPALSIASYIILRVERTAHK